MDKAQESFGKWLVEYRMAHGLSRKVFARKVGLSQAAIHYYEKPGKRETKPRDDTVWEIAKRLDLGEAEKICLFQSAGWDEAKILHAGNVAELAEELEEIQDDRNVAV